MSHPSDNGAHQVPPYVALDLDIPSDVGQIERVVQRVTEACQTLHLSNRQCRFNVPIALSEALANAILRGNKEDRTKRVRLRTTVSEVALVFDIIDEGAGFDLEQSTRDPEAMAAQQREDGRGLFLMRKLMDRVEQFYDHGNVVRLTLRRPHDQAPTS